MKKCGTALVLVALLIISSLAQLAMANFIPPPPGTPYGTIHINPDGTVTPSTVPVRRNGNLYTITADIKDYGFNIQCDNIVLDGHGRSLLGGAWYVPKTGIILNSRNNVTIQNIDIRGFNIGISINNSSGNVIRANKITNVYDHGIEIINQSTNNILDGNNISNNMYAGHAITISHSTHNTLRNNVITNMDRSSYWPSSNRFNFWLDYDQTGTPSEFINDIDASNIIDGKAICYWVNQHDLTVPSDVAYVALINCSRITVENLNLSNNGQGILLISTINSYIKSNNITNNYEGIVLINSSENEITENNMDRNVYGVVTYSEGNVFRSNHIDCSEKEPLNFGDGYRNDVDLSNMIDNSPLCYWINQHDKTVPSKAGYVFLFNCSRITIQNLVITNKTRGLSLVSTTDSLIINNTLSGNVRGICINSSSNNRITKNQITGDLADSIYLFQSRYNTVSENQITLCFIGLYVANSTDNLFTKNNIIKSNYTGVSFSGASKNILSGNRIENSGRCGVDLEFSDANYITANNVTGSRRCNMDTRNAQRNVFYNNNFDIMIRFNRDVQLSHQVLDIYASFSSTPSHLVTSVNNWTKNYWSDYNGVDDNDDGIGDTPYVINSRNQDSNPLMKAFNISNVTFPSPDWMSPPNVISTIVSFTEAISNIENTASSRWNVLGYTWKNEFTTNPLVTPDGLIDGHLQYYDGNGMLYEAVYPGGEVKGLIQQLEVADASSSDGYYVWCLKLMDGKRVFIDARNGEVLYTMLARVSGALLFDVAVRIANAPEPKMNLWDIVKYERVGYYSIEPACTLDKTVIGHYLKRTSEGTFYDSSNPIGPVPTVGLPKDPVLLIQASNDFEEYNIWEIRTQNLTYFIDARDGTIKHIMTNSESINEKPLVSPEASSTPIIYSTQLSLSIEIVILIIVVIAVTTIAIALLKKPNLTGNKVNNKTE